MRISDWSSDVCSSDLDAGEGGRHVCRAQFRPCLCLCGGASVRCGADDALRCCGGDPAGERECDEGRAGGGAGAGRRGLYEGLAGRALYARRQRSEEHTSELQSLMRISYAVFCLKKKNKKKL